MSGADDVSLVLLSDFLPTGLECGVLDGKPAPGCALTFIGAGLVGPAASMTAQLYTRPAYWSWWSETGKGLKW